MARQIQRICLWSSPRNISTALMYSFAQRKDTQVYDEPFYGYYLKKSKEASKHPGYLEIISSMENSGEKIVQMVLGEHKMPIIFFKNMAHHIQDLDFSFLREVLNVILIRNPADMIPSYAKVIKVPTIDGLGYAHQYKLYTELIKMNKPPLIIDSKTILLNPEKSLKKLCDLLQIPFYDDMLRWKIGGRSEDGIWAKYWYENVHNSNCFYNYKKNTEPFPERFKLLLDECTTYYNELVKHAIV